MISKCTSPCSCQVETCNTQAGVWNPQGAPPDLTVRSHCKDSSCRVIIGWISQRQAPGLLLLLLPVVGWGWQRKSPGVARGKSHQQSRETWSFLVFNPLSHCPLRADQSSTAPLPSFSGYLEYWITAGKVGKLLKVCRTYTPERGLKKQTLPRFPKFTRFSIPCHPYYLKHTVRLGGCGQKTAPGGGRFC